MFADADAITGFALASPSAPASAPGADDRAPRPRLRRRPAPNWFLKVDFCATNPGGAAACGPRRGGSKPGAAGAAEVERLAGEPGIRG